LGENSSAQIKGLNRSSKIRFDPLLPDKEEFAERGLKRWRNVSVTLRNWDIARWAGSYIAN
jgi:hypothetical protein